MDDNKFTKKFHHRILISHTKLLWQHLEQNFLIHYKQVKGCVFARTMLATSRNAVKTIRLESSGLKMHD